MLNRVVLIGRLTKAPELRQTPGGKEVVRFTLAVDRKYKKGEADYISCTAWDRTAESVAQYCGKGSLVAVDGRIQTGSYEKDGQRVYTTDVIAEDVRFIQTQKQTPNPSYGEAPEPLFDDGELPF